MASVADLVGSSIAEWGHGLLEQRVFGTDEPDLVAGAVERFCREHLGTPVADALFYTPSVGCVLGLALDDGRRVVLKAYQPRWTPDFLHGVREVQGTLRRRGFPCPRPLSRPAPVGPGLATVDGWLDDPGTVRWPAHRGLLDASATGLARLVGLCRDLDPGLVSPHPMTTPPGRLYPEPHSPEFDFEGTAEGAGWIDALAARGVELRDADDTPPVIAHCDWSMRNVRLRPDGVVAAYDMDSLTAVTESAAAGVAAATWSAQGEADDPVAPDPAEIVAWTRRYEEARGAPFTARQRAAVGGAALYVLAYTARCEHSMDPGGGERRRARPRLRSDGEALCHLADLFGP
jgi:hypothetical protein